MNQYKTRYIPVGWCKRSCVSHHLGSSLQSEFGLWKCKSNYPRPSVTRSTLSDFRHQAHQTILKNTLFKYTPLWKCKSNYLCYSYSAIEVSTLSHFRLKTHQTILKNIHTFKIQFSNIHFVGSANQITPAALSHN